MSEAPALRAPEEPGPTDFSDPLTVREVKRAAVWIAMAAAAVALWFLAQPILLIVGGLVFAAVLEGGTRLLGRAWKVRRGVRLAIVTVAGFAFILWVIYFAGASIAAQFETLKAVIQTQIARGMTWATAHGLITEGGGSQLDAIGKQLMGSVGQLTSAVGSALGALSSLAMIVVIGIFIAVEPKLYERGVAWMLPLGKRGDFYHASSRVAHTLRRLMAGRLTGMAAEGVFVAIALELIGVPMAMLLGILTGLLAFLPNIGAIVSGALIVLVGFSAGFNTGILAIVVYVLVQAFDGYIIVPAVARRAVDLPPALVLGAQLLFGALFGILGLALADPIVATLKVLLEETADVGSEEHAAAAPPPPPPAGKMPLEGV